MRNFCHFDLYNMSSSETSGFSGRLKDSMSGTCALTSAIEVMPFFLGPSYGRDRKFENNHARVSFRENFRS